MKDINFEEEMEEDETNESMEIESSEQEEMETSQEEMKNVTPIVLIQILKLQTVLPPSLHLKVTLQPQLKLPSLL